MIIGIDASNIRQGGGVTHLVELLREANPLALGFRKVVLWSGRHTLNQIEDREWLSKVHNPILERSLLDRLFWQKFKLKKEAQQLGCQLLFVPGGSSTSNFYPLVTMSQNMLPFEETELKRFGISPVTLKFLLLRYAQSKTFKRADGIIFLTKYAKDGVQKVTGTLTGQTINIPHGINQRFFNTPRQQRNLQQFTAEKPCRLIYVSIIDPYKHQWEVVKAVAMLRQQGISVSLDLIGPPGRSIKKLHKALDEVDPDRIFMHYHGAVEYTLLHQLYNSADIGIFASSCENMPNILLENMAAGLPIACSNKGPMPEILGNSGVYFNPEKFDEIAEAIYKLIASSDLRAELAESSFQKAQSYFWKRCAEDTFDFFAQIIRTKLTLVNKPS
jgi:glycosyltransferase involved in cell wall biosynthesis